MSLYLLKTPSKTYIFPRGLSLSNFRVSLLLLSKTIPAAWRRSPLWFVARCDGPEHMRTCQCHVGKTQWAVSTAESRTSQNFPKTQQPKEFTLGLWVSKRRYQAGSKQQVYLLGTQSWRIPKSCKASSRHLASSEPSSKHGFSVELLIGFCLTGF